MLGRVVFIARKLGQHIKLQRGGIVIGLGKAFNVVTADGIAMGVPSVVGSSIEWTPKDWWAEVEDPTSLVKTGLYLLNDSRAIDDGRAALKQYVRVGLEQWKDFLGR